MNSLLQLSNFLDRVRVIRMLPPQVIMMRSILNNQRHQRSLLFWLQAPSASRPWVKPSIGEDQVRRGQKLGSIIGDCPPWAEQIGGEANMAEMGHAIVEGVFQPIWAAFVEWIKGWALKAFQMFLVKKNEEQTRLHIGICISVQD